MAKGKGNGWADSKAAIKRRAGPHNVTLCLGSKVTVKVFGIGELLVRDAVPEHLRDTVALHLLNRDKGGIGAVIAGDLLELNRSSNGQAAEEMERFQQRLRDSREMTKRIAAEALVAPVVSFDELDDVFAWEELEELMRISTGQQPFDAEGVRVGVERIDSWATFQDEHRDGPCLGADCARCERARDRLSSLHVVPV